MEVDPLELACRFACCCLRNSASVLTPRFCVLLVCRGVEPIAGLRIGALEVPARGAVGIVVAVDLVSVLSSFCCRPFEDVDVFRSDSAGAAVDAAVSGAIVFSSSSADPSPMVSPTDG